MSGGMAKRLERIEGDYRKEALEAIKAARRNVAKIVTAAAREKGLKITGRNRDKLYALIDGEYAKLEVGLRSWSKDLVADGVKVGVEESRKALGKVDGAELTKFSRDLAERVFEIISPGNESQLAGVLTKKMADTDLSNLRKAQRDTERQAILEGWDTARKARELKMRWAELAGGMEEAKFVDAAGKTWNTDTYVDMLVGTTAQRTEREGFMEGLARNGDDLVKIEAQGSDACGVCADWDGRILSISGADKRFPSYEDAVAAGMFHPNCRCFLTRVDPEWDAEEIESQEKENAESAEEAGEKPNTETRRGRGTDGESSRGGAVTRRNGAGSDDNELPPARGVSNSGGGGNETRPMRRQATPRKEEDLGDGERHLNGGSAQVETPQRNTGMAMAQNVAETKRQRKEELARKGVEQLKRQMDEANIATDLKAKIQLAYTSDVAKEARPPEVHVDRRIPESYLTDDGKKLFIGADVKRADDLDDVLADFGKKLEAGRRVDVERRLQWRRERDMIGAKPIKGPHTWQDDMRAVNPDFWKGEEYQNNCPQCANAYIARTRGMDVTAKPQLLDGSDLLGRDPSAPFGGLKGRFYGDGGEATKHSIENAMLAQRDGAQALVRVVWKGAGFSHVFIAQQRGGETLFIDPQCGGDAGGWFQQIESAVVYMIDNRPFTKLLSRCCKI